MKSYPPDYLKEITIRIFQACGCPADEAETVADHLVLANLVGFDSHGVIRIPQYVQDVDNGNIVPGAPVRTIHETAAMAIVDAQWNFGQVGAQRATELAVAKARDGGGLASVVLRHARHVGMLGRYTLLAADHNCVGLAMCGSGKEGHRVAPWGGREGRISPNPIAFSAPTDGHPLLMDFSTSVAPEGKIRLMLNRNERLPEAWIVDADGRPSREPQDLYGPPQGAILAAGGNQGYKGFGLAVMAHILSGLLGDPVWQNGGQDANANSMWLLVIDIEKLMPPEQFRREMQELTRYLKSAGLAAGSTEILMPGEINFRERDHRKKEGIPIEAETWRQITTTARRLGVKL